MITMTSTANNNNFHHQLQSLNSHDAIFTSQKLSPFTIINKKDPLQQGTEKREEDGEIGVFGAEKYFNEGEVIMTPRSANIASSPKYLHQRGDEARSYKSVPHGSPSIRSESTTYNSQSALLQSTTTMWNNSTRNGKNKVHAKSFLAGLGLKCSCSDKDSVDTCDHGKVHGKTKPKKIFNLGEVDVPNHSISINKPKDVSFPKPILNSEINLPFSPVKNSGIMAKMQLLQIGQELDQPKKSLEVFGSPIVLNKKSKSFSIDKRVAITTMPSMEENDFSTHSCPNYNIDDDASSDASSDLFEIESFKGKSNTNNNNILARQTSDVASSCASPTNGYAPSEASIEWSVVTASAAVMSDCEEQMSEVTIRSPIRTTLNNPSNGKTKIQQRRHSSSMLLGCKSDKAVRVAGGDAFITYEKPSSSSQQKIGQVPRFPSGVRHHGQRFH